MASFPLAPESDWQQDERRQFLRAVESGAWEAALIFERSEVERRARLLLGPPEPLATSVRELEALRARLVKVAECVESPAATTAAPDVFLFNIVGWTHLTQRPNHVARGLAARGHRVFWVDVLLKDPSLTDSASPTRRLETNIFCVRLPAAEGEFYRLPWTPASSMPWRRRSRGCAPRSASPTRCNWSTSPSGPRC